MSILNQDIRPRVHLAHQALLFCLEGAARQALSADSLDAMSKALEAIREVLVALDAQERRANIPTNSLK
jgi:hypothetical protein